MWNVGGNIGNKYDTTCGTRMRTENNASYKKMFKKTKPLFSSFIGTPYYYIIIKIIIVIICFFLCSFFILLHSHHIFLT